jgi:hypothetical protein
VRNKSTLRIAVIGVTGLPLLFVGTLWAGIVLEGYLLTALLFGVPLVGEYPSLGSRRFFKAMLPIVVMHVIVLSGLVILSLDISHVNRLPRLVYGFLAVILAAEWRLSLRIIQASQSNEGNN